MDRTTASGGLWSEHEVTVEGARFLTYIGCLQITRKLLLDSFTRLNELVVRLDKKKHFEPVSENIKTNKL